MAKNNGWWWILFIAIGLVIGGVAGAWMFPVTLTVTETIEVPAECPECVAEVITETQEVPLNFYDTYILTAVDDFLSWMDDEDEYLTCGGHHHGEEYDIEQIAVSKIYDDYKVEFDDDKYEVCFEIKLKYLDEDVSEKCYRNLDVCVFYEPDEEPQITVGE